MMNRIERIAEFKRLLEQRILTLDGAFGTMVQRYKLDESGYRGERFKDWAHDLKGNNDVLVLSRPDIVSEIHRQYLKAGADILETNSNFWHNCYCIEHFRFNDFNSYSISAWN